MELALSLGDTPTKPFSFLEKSQKLILGEGDGPTPPVQLDLLPFSPVIQRSSQPAATSNKFPNFPIWLTQKCRKGEEGDGNMYSAVSSSSTFQMEFQVEVEVEGEEGEAERGGGSSRGSDEEENSNGSARKKLRLSKEQSAFLEESFKEHNTLNPKQKVALAKQLNLRPRQVEVWFQNRRARTKLKQTEVDCEYLKTWCETLREENRRLQKELQELRALKAASHPFYMHLLPATTLTMCPSCSCERTKLFPLSQPHDASNS